MKNISRKAISVCILIVFIYSFCLANINPTDHIIVDQFGYLPTSDKVCIINNPIEGFNALESFSPGNTYELRQTSNNQIVFSANIESWKNGLIHEQSGDQVWWFDFSSFTIPGSYYVFDPSNNVSSFPFEISNSVYKDVLKQAVRMFYYNRCNLEKVAPYAEGGWIDPNPNFVGPEQDTDCRAVLNPTIASSKDLSGGWFDAGDYNKYVNFADGPIHDLLFAYQENTDIWTDDFDIPESGNGIPDLIDEIKWELDWLLKMQLANGSVLHKVSVLEFQPASPPSVSNQVRRYGAATYSATVSACGTFAHAAAIFAQFPAMQSYSNTLRNAAINAWNWLEVNPNYVAFDNEGFDSVSAEDPLYEATTNRACAAVYLFALTGQNIYQNYFDDNWPNFHMKQWGFVYEYEYEYQNAALYYSTLPNATPDIREDIATVYEFAIQDDPDILPSYTTEQDAYRAYLTTEHYGWGSNSTKSNKGSIFQNMNTFGIDNDPLYSKIAEEYIHYIHGVNPLNMVYLSNMNNYGAEQSVSTMYHSWFTDGSPLWDEVGVSTYGPAPGFLVGGPNINYSPNLDFYIGDPEVELSPPLLNPTQKYYRDFNNYFPDDSYQLTEGAIYYQSAYIKLLAQFVNNSATTNTSVNCSAKVFLSGPFDSASELMNDDLRLKNLIPVTDPYSGTEQLSLSLLNQTGQNAIVDWVLLELRATNDPSQVISSKAVLVQRDGDVVDAGTGGTTIEILAEPGSYYLSIRHRNHLGVMTENSLDFEASQNIDFTNVNTTLYGFNPTEIFNGTRLLWLGNANGDSGAIFSGINNDVNNVFFSIFGDPNNNLQVLNYVREGYLDSDFNLDGQVIYQGIGNDPNFLFFKILTHPGNTIGALNYIIDGTVP